MLSLQVVPRSGVDVHRILRAKLHAARTWYWKNKAKTRLAHKQKKVGYIEIASADGVLVAQIHVTNEADTFFFVEKFVGRLVAWFQQEISAINIQFREEAAKPAKAKRKAKK